MKTRSRTFPYLALILIFLGSPFLKASPRETLILGLMPAVNIAPIVVAQRENLFEQEGVTIQIELFKNQVYRESALQAGKIDGTVSDLINAVNAVAQGFPLKATSASEGIFGLVAAPRSRFPDAASLRAAPPRTRLRTGLLENSIIFYVSERMLEVQGIDPRIMDLVPAPQLPARFEMLLAGRLDAACLPEPMLSLALRSGATLVADSESLPFTPGVILFTQQTLNSKPAAVRAFYRAYNRGVALLSRDPGRWKPLILEEAAFPPIAREFRLPAFSPAHPITQEVYEDVTQWMREKGLLRTIPPFDQVVDRSFLP